MLGLVLVFEKLIACRNEYPLPIRAPLGSERGELLVSAVPREPNARA